MITYPWTKKTCKPRYLTVVSLKGWWRVTVRLPLPTAYGRRYSHWRKE